MPAGSLAELLSDHQGGHSDLQIEQFITVKGHWTTYGRYKQCLREIDKRHRGLVDLREEAELAAMDLMEAEEPATLAVTDTRERTRLRIARDRQQRQLDQIQQTIAETERELHRFVAIASELKPQVGELTPERRNELDRELWSVRVRAMVALDMFTQGGLSPATAELLIALPAEIRKPILEDARTVQADGRLFDWLTDGPKALEE